MRGLPYRATDEEVMDFFKDYKVKEDSLQWGLGEDGRKNGWGAILLENEDEASRAAEGLNKQYIG
jgi:RNA recognition motif-containing protein